MQSHLKRDASKACQYSLTCKVYFFHQHFVTGHLTSAESCEQCTITISTQQLKETITTPFLSVALVNSSRSV